MNLREKREGRMRYRDEAKRSRGAYAVSPVRATHTENLQNLGMLWRDNLNTSGLPFCQLTPYKELSQKPILVEVYGEGALMPCLSLMLP